MSLLTGNPQLFTGNTAIFWRKIDKISPKSFPQRVSAKKILGKN
jgi:hypothetical protein